MAGSTQDNINYLNLDITIQKSGSNYKAILHSQSGENATVTFAKPFSDMELENFLLKAGQVRRGVRRIDTVETAAAKELGGKLYNTLFKGEASNVLRRDIDYALTQDARLRLRLMLTDVPELADLPWEYLYNPAANKFLALSVETPIVRYLELRERIPPLVVHPPLRVLMMVSSPNDYPALDVESEAKNLHAALGELERQGLVSIDEMTDANLPALQRRLRRGEYHIFHFIGHGGFDNQTEQGVLILEDENGRGRPVSGQDLGMLLHDHRSLRLAILNACEGARADRTDPFAGTAQSLVQQGIPAVIAMQFEITDQAAIAFAHEFYEAISDNYPVDAALTEARKTLFGMGHGLEWGTPVLYLRAPNGRIFDVQRSAEADRRAEVASLIWNANQAMEQEQWQQSIELWQSVLAKEPANAEATAKIAEARRNQQLVAMLDEGRAHLNAGRANEALETLQRVRSTAGTDFRGVDALIAEAQQKQRSAYPATQADQLRSQQGQQTQQQQPQLAVLYNEAQAAVAAEDWQRAIQRWQAILAIEPNNAQARGGLEYSQKQERLSAAYEDGLSKFRNRNWQEALVAFRWVRNNSGGTPYKQVESYIQQSEQAIAAAEAQTRQLNNAATYNTNTNTGPHQAVAPPIVTPTPVPVPRPNNTLKIVAITTGVVLTACVGILLVIGLLNKPTSDGGSNGGVAVLPTATTAQVIVGSVPTETPDVGIDPTDTPEQPAPTDTVAEPAPTDTAVVDLSGLTTYSAPTGYFTIGYPSDWTVTEGTDTVAFTAPAKDAVYVAGASPVNATLDEAGLLSATKTSLQNVFSGAAVSVNDSLATSGPGFASVGFTIIFQGKTYYGGAIGQQHGNVFYLTAQASESSATSTYLTVFGKMTSSFHYFTK